MSKEKMPFGMTIDEFKNHLKMMNDRVINFKEYSGSAVSKKSETRGNTGNFLRTVKIRKDRQGRVHKGKYG
tara:strand:- start:2098 stop:2310 length:213 start_codon:yes stop_codon:yes gene_type:complete